MVYEKQNFVNGNKLDAAQLNHIEDGLVKLYNVSPKIYSIVDYGAVPNNEGDMQHDLGTVIKTIIDTEQPGIIFIPAGEWWMTKDNVDIGIGTGWSIVGSGMEQTVIKSRCANNYGTIFQTIDAENVVFRDMTIFMKGTLVGIMDAIGIGRSRNVICERLKIETEWKAITCQGGGTNNVIIRDCVFVDNQHSAIALENESTSPSRGFLIEGCYFLINEGVTKQTENTLGVTPEDISALYLYASSSDVLTNIEVRSCTFKGSQRVLYGRNVSNVLISNGFIDGGTTFNLGLSKMIRFDNCRGKNMTGAVLTTEIDGVEFNDCTFEFSSNNVNLASVNTSTVHNVKFNHTTFTGASIFLLKTFQVVDSVLTINANASYFTLENGAMVTNPIYPNDGSTYYVRSGATASGTIKGLQAVKYGNKWRLFGWVYVTELFAQHYAADSGNSWICKFAAINDTNKRIVGYHMANFNDATITPVNFRLLNGQVQAQKALSAGLVYFDADMSTGNIEN